MAAMGETLMVELTYRLKQDIPAEIEYAAGYLSGPVLQGATFCATTANGDERRVE